MTKQHLAVICTWLLTSAFAAPYPFGDFKYPSRLNARNSSKCTDGELVCSSDGKSFGTCNWGSVAFQSVAAGTLCKDGAIVGAGDSDTPAPANGPLAPASSQATSSAAVSSSIAAPQPTSSNAGSQAAGQSASSTAAPQPTSSGASVPQQSSTPVEPTSTAADPTSMSMSAPSSTSTSSSNGEDYHVYLGNGEPSQGWPTMSQWTTFEDMWSKNLQYVISQGCSAFGQSENTAEDNDNLKAAILSEGQSSGVDPRFILGIVLQESSGCVRVDTTFGSVSNPGLMQSHNGSHTCYNEKVCPQSEIQGMIQDGAQGTPYGPGLKQLISQTKTQGVAKYYRAARMYNSGSISSNGLLQCGGSATNYYVSNVANRVTLQWYRGPDNFPENACPTSD